MSHEHSWKHFRWSIQPYAMTIETVESCAECDSFRIIQKTLTHEKKENTHSVESYIENYPHHVETIRLKQILDGIITAEEAAKLDQ